MFYRTQSAASFAQARAGAPARFVFAVKAAPGTTHAHALTGAGPSIERFVANLSALGHGRCPSLGQFPRTKKFDPAQRVPWLDQLPAALDGLALPPGDQGTGLNLGCPVPHQGGGRHRRRPVADWPGSIRPAARLLHVLLWRRQGPRSQLNARPATTSGMSTPLPDSLLTRIAALRAKTTDRGCTEQEALAAAAKVSELLDRHGLTLTEVELRSQPCNRRVIATNRARPAPFDECGPAVAALFDCRFWMETAVVGDQRRLALVFFGLPADVEAAEYLMHLIAGAFETEGNRFRRGPEYTKGRGNGRRVLHTSFALGMGHGIQQALRAMQAARAARHASTGRDLVVTKAGVVDAEYDKLGLRMRTRVAADRRVNRDAYGSGHAAGERFQAAPGLNKA